ncbi:Hypothetical protein PHPALM_9924 [Phytophthora palmivora]|uniref:Uncharacterized protein n=1 Tax=Phytophthora palmivora TaxID=4796 RepID=A0A2P4Y5Z8_9STRA|nr:Hypothetical protein PHPALM_9924 [Phytophthora palmivora]
MGPRGLQVELEESTNATLDRCHEARPTNTPPRICAKTKRVKITRCQLTAARMLLLRSEEVVVREIRVKNSTRKVGIATVEMYVIKHPVANRILDCGRL